MKSLFTDCTTSGAPIDAYGVGTRVGTSADAPTLDIIYKLVQYGDEPALKLSTGKQTLVGPKQVWRRRDERGCYASDILAARDEPAPGESWEPLLRQVMRDGQILDEPTLDDLRARHRAAMDALPGQLRDVTSAGDYPVEISDELQRRQAAAEQAVREREGLADDQLIWGVD